MGLIGNFLRITKDRHDGVHGQMGLNFVFCSFFFFLKKKKKDSDNCFFSQ
jgi:hypothetical protein